MEAAFTAGAFGGAFAGEAFAKAGLGFNALVELGVLAVGVVLTVLTATGFGFGGCTPALGALFAVSCFLAAGFAAAEKGLAGAFFLGGTEALVFFFKLWPEATAFFFPPALERLVALEGLAFLGETGRVLFFFEEADLAADLTFLLATLSP